jgi:hypothetical protein
LGQRFLEQTHEMQEVYFAAVLAVQVVERDLELLRVEFEILVF